VFEVIQARRQPISNSIGLICMSFVVCRLVPTRGFDA
jgi:hypothetical protein